MTGSSSHSDASSPIAEVPGHALHLASVDGMWSWRCSCSDAIAEYGMPTRQFALERWAEHVREQTGVRPAIPSEV